jgi:hypothetical protein
MFKGYLSVCPLQEYFILVCSAPSITLPYPFTFPTPHFQQLSIYLLISSTLTSYVLQNYWCSIFLFSFPSFSKSHKVVPLLQTHSTSEFVYDHACFCAYVCLLDL